MTEPKTKPKAPAKPKLNKDGFKPGQTLNNDEYREALNKHRAKKDG